MVSTKVQTGKVKFVFTDNNDKIFASFCMDPADLKTVIRCNEAIEFLSNRKPAGFDSPQEFGDYIEIVAEKIADVAGCDKSDIFGNVSAVSVLPSGELFCTLVLKTMKQAIENEAQKRRAARMEVLKKYTANYDGNPNAGLAPGQAL